MTKPSDALDQQHSLDICDSILAPCSLRGKAILVERDENGYHWLAETLDELLFSASRVNLNRAAC